MVVMKALAMLTANGYYDVGVSDPEDKQELLSVARTFSLALRSMNDVQVLAGVAKLIEEMQGHYVKPAILLDYCRKASVASGADRALRYPAEEWFYWRDEDGKEHAWHPRHAKTHGIEDPPLGVLEMPQNRQAAMKMRGEPPPKGDLP